MSTEAFAPGEVLVFKLGSSLLTDPGKGLAVTHLHSWVDQIAELHGRGSRIVIVSSGSVVEGMNRLGLLERPESIHQLQAAASVGQSSLVQAWESRFHTYGILTGQVLLTHADLRSRERYLNARSTLTTLLSMGVIPIVNENDTVVTDEIRFGDNDTLAALVANLISASTLVLMTDQMGLYTADPRRFTNSELVTSARASDASLDAMVGMGSALGRGGMITKLAAARMAARSGANTLIVSGREDNVIRRIADGEPCGTLLTADQPLLVSRKQWLASLPARGGIVVDAGAARVLRSQGVSLLPVGAIKISGDFKRGDMVSCLNEQGEEVARGLSNYAAEEAEKLCGHESHEIEQVLEYKGDEELVHRDNMVIITSVL